MHNQRKYRQYNVLLWREDRAGHLIQLVVFSANGWNLPDGSCLYPGWDRSPSCPCIATWSNLHFPLGNCTCVQRPHLGKYNCGGNGNLKTRETNGSFASFYQGKGFLAKCINWGQPRVSKHFIPFLTARSCNEDNVRDNYALPIQTNEPHGEKTVQIELTLNKKVYEKRRYYGGTTVRDALRAIFPGAVHPVGRIFDQSNKDLPLDFALEPNGNYLLPMATATVPRDYSWVRCCYCFYAVPSLLQLQWSIFCFIDKRTSCDNLRQKKSSGVCPSCRCKTLQWWIWSRRKCISAGREKTVARCAFLFKNFLHWLHSSIILLYSKKQR